MGVIAFAAKYVPETKDKSLEDVEHCFKNAATTEPEVPASTSAL